MKSVEIYYYFSVEEEEKKIEGMLIMRRNCTGEWNTMKAVTERSNALSKSKIIQFSMMCLAARSEAGGGGGILLW